MKLSKTFAFEASHQIYNHLGKCANLHGHSWVFTVTVDGKVNKATGMVIDYYEIKKVIQPIIDRLDHTHLGSGAVYLTKGDTTNTWLGPSHETSLPELPTSENLLVWIGQQLPKEFVWSSLIINETCTSEAELSYEEFIQIVN